MKSLFILIILSLTAINGYSQNISFDKNLGRGYNNRSYFRKMTILTLSIGLKSWYKNNINKADSFSAPNFSENLIPIYIKAERTLSNGFGLGIYGAYTRFSYYCYSPNTTNTYSYRTQVGAAGITGFYHFYKYIPVQFLDVYVAIGAGINYVQHKLYNEYNNSAITIETPADMSTDITPVMRLGARYFVDKHAALAIEGGYDKLSILNIGFSFRF